MAAAVQESSTVANAMGRSGARVLQGSLGTQPLLPSQRPEKRVVALQPGSQALLAQPGPNPANENSAVLVYYQACHPSHFCSPVNVMQCTETSCILALLSFATTS